MKGSHKRGGAQWANLGGQTLQLEWLVNCKDPMHDCNRFLWQILHTGETEHISQNVSLEFRTQEAGHIRLPNTEDDPSIIYIGVHNQSAIYWWKGKEICLTDYKTLFLWHLLLVKGKRNLLHRLHNFIFVTPIMILNLTHLGNEEIQMQSNQMLDPK